MSVSEFSNASVQSYVKSRENVESDPCSSVPSDDSSVQSDDSSVQSDDSSVQILKTVAAKRGGSCSSVQSDDSSVQFIRTVAPKKFDIPHAPADKTDNLKVNDADAKEEPEVQHWEARERKRKPYRHNKRRFKLQSLYKVKK